MSKFTDQENFWAGEFGNDYINRNNHDQLIINNEKLFRDIINHTVNVNSICEFGCNIGLNLIALNNINNKLDLSGYEINQEASEQAKRLNIAKITNCSILENLNENLKFDLTFTKGVMIHINPNYLKEVYKNLYNQSNKYILICEYYNPTPVTVKYRTHDDKLFKRDFAGEMIDSYKLKLNSYGFFYHRDIKTPHDDINWFLLEK